MSRGRSFFRFILRIAPILIFVGVSFYFYFFSSPEGLIDFVGVDNAYVLILLLAFFGGLTTFSGVPYHLFLVTMAAGGLNPFLLGATAAAGVMIGDSTSYYIGYHGGTIVSPRVQAVFHRLYEYASARRGVLPVFSFLYGSFVPFSNDFITISAGLARYSFWRVMIPLALGNLVFNVGLAYLSANAHGLLRSLPLF